MPAVSVLGIDPGLNKTGYAIIKKEEGGEYILLKSGIFRVKSKNFEDKIFEISKNIENLLKENILTLLVIEDIFRGLNIKSALKSAHLKGAIIFLAKKYGLEIKVVAPTEVKIIITGYGRADKEQIKRNLKNFIKNLPKYLKEDESDAIAIALSSFFL